MAVSGAEKIVRWTEQYLMISRDIYVSMIQPMFTAESEVTVGWATLEANIVKHKHTELF